MPIKLQVVKEEDDDPADYLFEQDRITIGRGSGNDLTLPDQKVSTEHAEIRSDGGEYYLYYRDSKNKTYVDGERVGEEEAYQLKSGDIFQVGDFQIEFAPLFMPSSEQTAFAEDSEEDKNPFEKHARQLSSALEGLAETYKFAPKDQRDETFAEAVSSHLDPEVAEEVAVQHLLDRLGASTGEQGAAQSEGAADASGDVLDTLLEGVARMISIPDHFWREFTGKDLDHPPEKAVFHDADLDELRAHLLDDEISAEERKQRLQHLSEAVDSLVAHNMAMLAGYKKAVMAGSQELLQQVNPSDAVEEGGGGGFFGGGNESGLEQLEEKWKELYREEWGTLENRLFRPTYVEEYVDRMAKAWDLDRAEIMPGEDTA